MALTTYTELKASVADWINRDDLTAVIVDFISLAEAQIERTLRTTQMIVRATASIDGEYSAVPADFLETRTVKLNTNPIQPLQFETVDSLDSLRTQYTAPGRPQYFGIVGTQIRVVPVPDTTYTAELIYYGKLTKLSSANATNWLLTSSPDIYLYGALLQGAPYLQNDERIQTWATLYERGLNDLKIADDRGSTSGGALLARTNTFGVRYV
jgi:hypothetical protein